MAINRNYSQLLVTGTNGGDWTLSNASLTGNQGYLFYDYSDDSSERVKEIVAQVAGGGSATTVEITSPSVNARSIGIRRVMPLYLLGVGNTANSDNLKFLASPDGGTTYFAHDGTTWSVVAEADILTGGMSANQLRNAGTPPGNNTAFTLKCAVAMPITATTTTLYFAGYQIITGLYDGGVSNRILDFRGDGADYFDPEQLLRYDDMPEGVGNGFGGTVWPDFDNSSTFYEPSGLIIRGSDPNDTTAQTNNAHYFVDTIGIDLSRQLSIRTTGTENESNQLFRFLVLPDAGPGLSAPVNSTDFNSRSWKAWDGDAWQTVTGTDVSDFQTDGSNGMSAEQFNDADWTSLGITNDGFLLLIFGERFAYNEDTDDDFWIESIRGYPVTYENSTTITSPAATNAGGGIYENNSGTIVMGWHGRLMEYSDVRGAALPPSHIANEGTIDSYSAGTFPGTLPYFIARQSETLNTVDFNGVSSSTTYPRYYGPLYEANSTLEYDKHWPSTDWTNGLIVHIVSGTGAGQWGILGNRSKDDAWKFELLHPFATAPAAGDRFVIGSLVWVTLPEISAAPFLGKITIGTSRLIIKLRAGSPKFTVEAYTGQSNWEVTNPAHPWRPDTVRCAELTLANTREPSVWEFNQANSSGYGSRGREVSLSIIGVVGHEDYLIDTLATKVEVPPEGS